MPSCIDDRRSILVTLGERVKRQAVHRPSIYLCLQFDSLLRRGIRPHSEPFGGLVQRFRQIAKRIG